MTTTQGGYQEYTPTRYETRSVSWNEVDQMYRGKQTMKDVLERSTDQGMCTYGDALGMLDHDTAVLRNDGGRWSVWVSNYKPEEYR
jgi:hypothetical protein